MTTTVLWLIRGLGPGGAERLLVAHAQAGADDVRYEVAYQVAAKDQLVPALEGAGVTVHRLPGRATWPAALRRLVATRDIDVVHAHAPAMAVGARVALRAVPGGPRPALVYTEHNRWSAYRGLTRWANAATFAVDDRTFAVSEEARSSVWSPLRGRVEALHHGIDVERLRASTPSRAEARRALGLDDGPMVAQVANFRREKAHEVALEAARALRGAGTPVQFWLVGQGQRLEEIRALIAAEGLEDVVQLLGFRDDVSTVLAAADALVLSSDHEGLPVAVMEALALGVPVVATAVGGIPEAVTDGVEGLLVPPRSPAALAAAISRVIGDPALRSQLGAGAWRRGASFDVSVPTARIEDAYRSLTGQAGAD